MLFLIMKNEIGARPGTSKDAGVAVALGTRIF
jgi:hypothetical protein